MNRFKSIAPCAVGFLLAVGQASAATVTTLSVDFESPTFSVGAVAGQGGWGVTGSVSTAQAYRGTQSLQTVLVGYLGYSGATKALDATGGEYPFAGNNFVINYPSDWWVQARVNVASSGGGARMGFAYGCPYMQISGTGTPTVEPCIGGVPPVDLTNQGANVLDQWVLLRMAHTTSMLQDFQISIIGDNVNVSATMGYSGPNGTSTQAYIVLGGDAYWDDVSAGYGPAPEIVPAPGAAWLLVTGLGMLAGRLRRRNRLSFPVLSLRMQSRRSGQLAE